MNGIQLLQYMLLVWGVVYLITQSIIFVPFRMLIFRAFRRAGRLLYCPSCTGFWVGLALGALGYWHSFAWLARWIDILESGFAAMTLGSIWGVYFGNPDVFRMELELLTDNEKTSHVQR